MKLKQIVMGTLVGGSLLLSVSLGVLSSAPAHAAPTPPTTTKATTTTKDDPGKGSKCDTAILPKTFCSGGKDAIWGILNLVLTIMAGGVGILAVGGLVYAAILYTSAQDNEAQVKKAKDTIANVVIGIVAFALMYSFLNFLIPGGVFK